MKNIFTPPLISVIIPCYNVENYIEECMNSIIHQSYKNLEIIVVNDGSMDNTKQRISLFLEDKRVKYIEQENQGQSKARNSALEIMQGKYVCFVDGDDCIHRDFIKFLYQEIIENNADISVCDFIKFQDSEKIDFIKDSDNTKNILKRKEAYNVLLTDVRLCVVWNKLYKVKLFDKLRFEMGRNYEDELLIHHILGKVEKIVMSNRKLYYYRQRIGSIMSSGYTDDKLKDAIYAFDDRINYYKENNIPNIEKLQDTKWFYLIYCKGVEEFNLDYAKHYILSNPWEFFKYSRIRFKKRIQLYLKLMIEKM